jgi:hypothetical protein
MSDLRNALLVFEIPSDFMDAARAPAFRNAGVMGAFAGIPETG